MKYNLDMVSDFPIRMEGDYGDHEVVLVAAKIEEKFNRPARTRIEFAATDHKLDLQDFVGKPISLFVKVPEGSERTKKSTVERKFSGTCISAEYLGSYEGAAHYSAEIRPKHWFLGMTRDCRVFQELSAKEIVEQVLREHGIDFTTRLNDTYLTRVICIQYRETDLDFIHRLMEEEGIHYYLDHEGGEETLILADNNGPHSPAPREDKIAFRAFSDQYRRNVEHLYDFDPGESATTGKVTLNDYDFEKPRADLKGASMSSKGAHPYKDYEHYDYQGHYTQVGDGEKYARVRVEANAIKHKVTTGTGLVSNLEPGRTFKVKDHPRVGAKEGFVVSESTQYLRLNRDSLERIGVDKVADQTLLFAEEDDDAYMVRFKALPEKELFRPEAVTPWPAIAGVQTALVTGPGGEEIHTDEYGRIRIQFHWDREGEKNEKSTCWVRCMMPWVGKQWGMIAIPRVGQEVVVQFEDGNPDRPLVVGMVYNKDNMPPYDLPDNKTQSGVKTMSSKEGNAKTFNELRFEDKKGAEEVYFHAEKDFNQVVENNATIEVGQENGKKGKDDKGDMTLDVWHDQQVTIGNDQTTKVGFGDGGKNKGDRSVEVYNDHTEKVGHDQKVDIGYGAKEPGSQTLKVNKDRTTTIGMNDKMTVEKGNYDVKVSMGKITMEAMQSIELKVGGNSIKIDQSGITLKGLMIKVNADAMVKTDAPMVKTNGSGMVMIQGGLVKIN